MTIFAPNFAYLFGTKQCTNVLLVLYSLDIRKLTETQPSRTNFTTEQKVYFIIKIIERRVQPVVTLLNFYVYVQRSTVINFSIFQVVG